MSTNIMDKLDIMFIEVKALRIGLDNKIDDSITTIPTDDDYRKAIRQIFDDDEELTDEMVDILLTEIKDHQKFQDEIKSVFSTGIIPGLFKGVF